MTMVDYAISVLLVALLATFSILLLKKWNVIEWLQVHGSVLIHKLASCDFCLSFWACVVLSAIAVTLCGNGYLMFVPFFAAPITRILL